MAGKFTGQPGLVARLYAEAMARVRRRPQADGETGAAAVEFALVLPVLMLILFAIIQLGLALYNYEMLTGAVRAASRNFAITRGTNNPFTTTQNVLEDSGVGLNSTYLGTNMKLYVNGSPCTSDASCVTLQAQGAIGEVYAQYPCTIVVMGINAAPGGCTLKQQTEELIE
jgi:Flp pilus assembly protein TadG